MAAHEVDLDHAWRLPGDLRHDILHGKYKAQFLEKQGVPQGLKQLIHMALTPAAVERPSMQALLDSDLWNQWD